MISAARTTICAFAVFIALTTPLDAQLLGRPRADSTVRDLITRIANKDTVRMGLPFEPESLAAHGITRDSLLRMLAAGFDIGHVRKAEPIDRIEFHPFNATRVDEQIAYHVVGEHDSRLVFVWATTDSGRTLLTGLRWQQAPANLYQMNPFRLAGKSWLHYLILVFAIVIPLFSFTTAVVAVRSRVPYRWVWAVACLVSLGKLSIVWSDASARNAVVLFNPVNVQLLGAGIVKYPLYAPWRVAIALPVFAFAYWVVARFRVRAASHVSSVAA